MKSHVSAVFMPFAFALVFSVVAAEGEGWDNIDPARKEREPAKLYWEAPLAKGATATPARLPFSRIWASAWATCSAPSCSPMIRATSPSAVA